MYELAKAILFRLDAEAAHDLVARQVRRAESIGGAMSLLSRLARLPRLPKKVWGLEFANPLGIAAGFDKNAEMIPFLRAIGFGFVEVGTITLRAQPGNPKPRMFRYPSQHALVNRLGFNNEGAHAASRRLEEEWNSPEGRSARVDRPLFANIGKNRDVPIEEASENYLACYRVVAPWVDGIVVNVSSPNTAALRDLQRPEHLESLLGALKSERLATRFVREEGSHPIILKIAPDLDDAQLAEVADVAAKLADGVTATNTTVDRSLLGPGPVEIGGISGAPLLEPSTALLRKLRRIVGSEFPIIGVGGILDGEDAARKLDAGATLIQAYTGFIYGGPGFPSRVVRHLGACK
jgi:dihydroorotate dehydrogenase